VEAAEATGVDGAAAGGAAGGAAGAEARKDAGGGATVAWQGTQLRLCAAALDSLKRELARERATASSAREEARRSDSVAEQAPLPMMMHAHCMRTVRALCTAHPTPHIAPQTAHRTPHTAHRTRRLAWQALTMMQQLREEGAQLEARLSAAEAQGLHAQQQLRQREAELYGTRRAQQGSARDIARAVAQFEESCMQRLQRIEGSLEQRAQAVGGAQKRVAVAMQRRRDAQLEQWVKTLV
jgi:hypothetical protein